MPSKRCPTCPFNDLCTEEKQCPILQESQGNSIDIKEELRQFAKMKYLKIAEQAETSAEASRGC
ncbi:hypothetical protein MUP77_21110 [Candidatus Bathyarchaeota archaeon]|nr:hypothetical protein [Candidatus Bathyarchaeota archaeon]